MRQRGRVDTFNERSVIDGFRQRIVVTLFAATKVASCIDDDRELVPPGHGPSFRCASGDLHWTFTVEPDVHVPVIDVPGVRWMIQ